MLSFNPWMLWTLLFQRWSTEDDTLPLLWFIMAARGGGIRRNAVLVPIERLLVGYTKLLMGATRTEEMWDICQYLVRNRVCYTEEDDTYRSCRRMISGWGSLESHYRKGCSDHLEGNMSLINALAICAFISLINELVLLHKIYQPL